MKVGVVSDTHGWFHPALTSDLAGCEVILHAGDVGEPAVLDGLSAIAPVRVVVGNIDGGHVRRQYPVTDRFELAGVRFWMTHIAGRPGRWESGLGHELREDPPDVLICGHSHILRIERVPVSTVSTFPTATVPLIVQLREPQANVIPLIALPAAVKVTIVAVTVRLPPLVMVADLGESSSVIVLSMSRYAPSSSSVPSIRYHGRPKPRPFQPPPLTSNVKPTGW